MLCTNSVSCHNLSLTHCSVWITSVLNLLTLPHAPPWDCARASPVSCSWTHSFLSVEYCPVTKCSCLLFLKKGATTWPSPAVRAWDTGESSVHSSQLRLRLSSCRPHACPDRAETWSSDVCRAEAVSLLPEREKKLTLSVLTASPPAGPLSVHKLLLCLPLRTHPKKCWPG